MAGGLRAQDGPQLTRPPLPDFAPTGTAGSGRLPFGEASPVHALRAEPLAADFFVRPVAEVARALLGSCLLSTVGGERAAVIVVEAEAYGGAEDPASHASTRQGVTRRNRAMFGPPGRAYVYRSYGVHWCLNVVTGPEGEGQAVLLRGAVPLEGIDVIRRRRDGRMPLAAGPGRLAQALGVTDELYGHRLGDAPLVLLPGWDVDDARVGLSGRIGITTAAERPLRFYVRGAPGVSGRPR
jgi:DNA-3-methyladenine glycosylase